MLRLSTLRRQLPYIFRAHVSWGKGPSCPVRISYTKELSMRKSMLVSLVVAGAMSSLVYAKRDPDVNKTLKREYPDAQTQVVNVREINGVKVSFVNIKTKDGDATAQVTEYGDLVSYGLPRGKEGPYM